MRWLPKRRYFWLGLAVLLLAAPAAAAGRSDTDLDADLFQLTPAEAAHFAGLTPYPGGGEVSELPPPKSLLPDVAAGAILGTVLGMLIGARVSDAVGALKGMAAGALHQLPDFRPGRPELAAPPCTSSRGKLATIHREAGFKTTVVDGITVTTIMLSTTVTPSASTSANPRSSLPSRFRMRFTVPS